MSQLQKCSVKISKEHCRYFYTTKRNGGFQLKRIEVIVNMPKKVFVKCKKIEGRGWVRVDVNKEFKLLRGGGGGLDVKKLGARWGQDERQSGCERRIEVIVNMQNCNKKVGGGQDGGRVDVNKESKL